MRIRVQPTAGLSAEEGRRQQLYFHELMQMHASLQRRQEDLLQEREKQQNEELQRAETERMEAQRQQRLAEPPRLSSEELAGEQLKIEQMVSQMESLQDFDRKRVG